MIDHKTVFFLNVIREDNKTVDQFPILMMEMQGYPHPTVKVVTIHNGTEAQMLTFDPNKMSITEEPKDAIVKIRMRDGHLTVLSNKNMNYLEVFGLIEMGKVHLSKNVFDNHNRIMAVKN